MADPKYAPGHTGNRYVMETCQICEEQNTGANPEFYL